MSAKFVSNCLKFSSTFIFLLVLQSASAQGNKKSPKELGVDTYADLDAAFLKNAKSLGKDAVAELWTDTLVYKHEVGEFDSRQLAPIDATSKWLTTVLVLKLAEEGKISLDDKIGQYIPLFDTYGKSYITIRHCLSHYTGIQSDNKLFGKKKFGSLEDEVNSYAKKEIQTNPGTEFRYSEIGVNIAGRVLEIVYKKKFDMLIKQRLFNPLGMRKTTFSTMDGSAIDPSSGAQSSADEMMIFLKMLLRNGQHNGQRFLSDESMAELKKITTVDTQIAFAPRTTMGLGYALGSWVIDANSAGSATALAGTAITGTFPLIDWCRGYALLVFVKSGSGEQKKETYMELKEAADSKFSSQCK